MGGASTIFSRPDLVLVSPGHQVHISSAVNASGPAQADLFDLWWSDSNPLTISQLLSAPLTFVDNDIRYVQNDADDLFFGFNISEFTNWMQFNTGQFYDYPSWCAELPRFNCGANGPMANRFHTDDASWISAGAPDRSSSGRRPLLIIDRTSAWPFRTRYQNPTTLDRELGFVSQTVRSQRRGQWTSDYGVYNLLNFFRAYYGQEPVKSPYAN